MGEQDELREQVAALKNDVLRLIGRTLVVESALTRYLADVASRQPDPHREVEAIIAEIEAELEQLRQNATDREMFESIAFATGEFIAKARMHLSTRIGN